MPKPPAKTKNGRRGGERGQLPHGDTDADRTEPSRAIGRRPPHHRRRPLPGSGSTVSNRGTLPSPPVAALSPLPPSLIAIPRAAACQLVAVWDLIRFGGFGRCWIRVLKLCDSQLGLTHLMGTPVSSLIVCARGFGNLVGSCGVWIVARDRIRLISGSMHMFTARLLLFSPKFFFC